MICFPIDFVRQVIEQTLFEEHVKNEKLFGGSNQVNLFSFYEQLQKEEEVNRYVEIYRDLTEQQNRLGLIMNGTIIAPENPTITNINQCLIIPMSFTCSFRVKLKDRDSAIDTINNLIQVLKGRKQDIAELDNGSLFKVGTIGNNISGNPLIRDGDFLGVMSSGDIDDDCDTKMTTLTSTPYSFTQEAPTQEHYYYVENSGKIKVVKYYQSISSQDETINNYEYITDQDLYPNIPFPKEHNSFTKYSLSLSFDSIRCDEPRNLNADEYCVISFGGSATLVSKGVYLGNEMTKLSIKKLKVLSKSTITITDTQTWLEPLEIPSGNNADTRINQLVSNNFVSNTHTDSIAISLQYTFILDRNIPLLNQFFKYARYGIQASGSSASTYANAVSPNVIYEIKEIWSSWGDIDQYVYKGKIIESIDIENTEADTLTITLPIQVQGDNN